MIEKVFNLLDSWRLLPAYQLERRADIFFAIYLSDIIQDILNLKVVDIIPELPIRIGTIRPEIEVNKSYKIDYCLFTESKEVLLVELKTDEGSIREDQMKYYFDSLMTGCPKIIKGIIDIYSATSYKEKYKVLINKLIENGSVEIEGETLNPNHLFSFFPKPIIIKPSSQAVNGTIVIDFVKINSIIAKI